MSTCSLCKDVCEYVAKKAIKEGSCEAGALVIGAAFTAAEVIFFELDEILPEIEAAFEIVWEVVCNELGFDWIEKNVKEFADKVCKQAKIC